MEGNPRNQLQPQPRIVGQVAADPTAASRMRFFRSLHFSTFNRRSRLGRDCRIDLSRSYREGPDPVGSADSDLVGTVKLCGSFPSPYSNFQFLFSSFVCACRTLRFSGRGCCPFLISIFHFLVSPAPLLHFRPCMFRRDGVIYMGILQSPQHSIPPLPLRRLYLRAGDFLSAGKRGWERPSSNASGGGGFQSSPGRSRTLKICEH
jgi:hypothetical protein